MKTISPTLRDQLQELATITKARQDNWRDRSAPINATLEEVHKERIASIQQSISALPSSDGPGTSEAPPAIVTSRGGCAMAAGILRRIKRIFQHALVHPLPNYQTTMKLQLTEDEKAEIIPQIRKVVETGEPWEAESMHHPVEAIVGAILEIPGVERQPLEDARYGIEGFETNGWQWDWWQDFKHDGKRYTLAGSGYYGGHAFHLSDEQDED